MKKLLMSIAMAISLILPSQTNVSTTENEKLELIPKFQEPQLPMNASMKTAQIAGLTVNSIEPITIQENPQSSTIKEEKELDQVIFDLVLERSGSEYLAAAFVGNAMYESHLVAYRWESDLEKDENGIYILSKNSTDKINELLEAKEFEKAKVKFSQMNPMHNESGFGLFGFTCYGMKQMLIDFAIATGRNIDDPEMQVEFVIYYISSHKPDLWSRLCNDISVKDATERFAGGFEKCENSEHSYYMRVKYAKEAYEKYKIS